MDLTPIGPERDPTLANWILSPFARIVTGKELDAEAGFGLKRAIVTAKRENGGSGAMTDLNSVQLRAVIVHLRKFRREGLVEGRMLRREQRIQRFAGSLSDGRAHGSASAGRSDIRVALISAFDGINGIEYCDMDDGHGTTRSRRPELFAKSAGRVPRRQRSVIKATRVHCNRVPMTNKFACARSMRNGQGRLGQPG